MKYTLTLAVVAMLISTACKNTKNAKNTSEASVESAKVTPALPDSLTNYYPARTRFWDLTHTRLEIKFNWDSCFLYGKAELSLSPIFYTQNTIELDAKGFKIIKINIKDAAESLNYTYDGEKLNITLPTAYKRGQNVVLAIDYIAMPNRRKIGGSAAISSDKGLYFINADGKNPNVPKQIWTQGETESSSCWFPTFDSPNERQTQEIYITTEANYTTLSNGLLIYSTNNADGTRTDYWKQDLPHAPYLTMMAIGTFKIVKDKWRDMEVSYYVEPEYEAYARLNFGKTPEMIEFFSKTLGVDYPWEKYSQVVAREYVSGAMENTSATLHGDFLNLTPRERLDNTGEDVISHELFHQWFGDLVTAESWPNLPLNESFATYGEYLWNEYKYGRDEADFGAQNDLRVYLSTDKQKHVNLVRFDLKDREDMFDGISYQKGGRVLHMLRKYVGDEAFFASLKLYLTKNKFTAVEMPMLRQAFEETTGQDLNWFFDQWAYSAGNPKLNIDYVYDEANKKATVYVEQTQDFTKNPLFKLPVTIDIYANGAKERRNIIVDKRIQKFEFSAESKPDLINFDGEKILLCVKTDTHTDAEFRAMYRLGGLYLDRFEALKAMGDNAKDADNADLIVEALNDKFWNIRNFAVSKITKLDDAHKATAYNTLVKIAQTDEKSSVRSNALLALADLYPEKDINSVLNKAETDSSFSVISTLMEIYTDKDSAKAIALANTYKNEKYGNVKFGIAGVLAKYGKSEDHDFFVKFFDAAGGYTPLYMLTDYSKYIQIVDANTQKQAADVLFKLAKNNTVNLVRSSASGVLAKIYEKAKNEEVKAYSDGLLKELDKN